MRSLGRSGFEVWAGQRSRRAQSFYSRYCTRSFQYPAPSREYDRFIEFMLDFLRRHPCDVLMPTSDYSTLFASTHREELASLIRLAVPDAAALSIAMDKSRTLEAAYELGIEIPVTYCPRGADELQRLSRRIEYPCVLKPRRGAGAVGILYARSAAFLSRELPVRSEMEGHPVPRDARREQQASGLMKRPPPPSLSPLPSAVFPFLSI